MTVIHSIIYLYKLLFANNVLSDISTNEHYSMSQDGPSNDEQWEQILAKLRTDCPKWDTQPSCDQWAALTHYRSIFLQHDPDVRYPMKPAEFDRRVKAKFRDANCGYDYGTDPQTITDAKMRRRPMITAQENAQAQENAKVKAQAKAQAQAQAQAKLLSKLLKLHALEPTTAAEFKEYCAKRNIVQTGL